ncbi:hypothetical protein, partial [Prevotella intermedia]|uniref:hypothetical protein n=1 Tax=Prevotella intermedia TaxID=28131 RepID=UPI000BE72788
WGGVLGFLDTLELVGEGGLVAVEIGALEALGILGLAAEGILVAVEIGALDFLGVLELGLEGIFVAERVGAIGILGGLGLGWKEGCGGYLRFRGFSRNMRSKFKTSINIQKFNSVDWYM